MYAGPGAGSIMVAASAWDSVAAELATAASGYHSVIAELTGGPWVGPSSTAMVSAVAPYASWLGAASELAEVSAGQARAAAAAFEAAFIGTVPPPVIAANRMLMTTLIATNFFGQNTPSIMATEAQYLEMWAQDATAMYAYAATSAAATVLSPYSSPPNTSSPEGLLQQELAVTRAAAQPAGNVGQTAAAATTQLTQAAVPQLLGQLSSGAAVSPFTTLQDQIKTLIATWLPTPTSTWWQVTPAHYTAVLKSATGLPYFTIGMGNFGWSIGQQTVRGIGTTAGSGGAWFPTPQFAGLHLGGIAGAGAVSGNTGGPMLVSAGSAGKVGMLSVPSTWANPATEATLASAVMEDTPLPVGTAGGPGGAGGLGNSLLRGIPAGLVGRRAAGYGYTNKYGFKHSVLTRPPSAG